MRFAHVADTHLGVRSPLPPEGAGGAFLDRQLAALDAVCADAIERGAELLVSAGDLFDSNRVSAATSARLAALVRGHAELTFVLLPGGGRASTEVTGHDAYTVDSVYRRVELSALRAGDHAALLTPDAAEYRYRAADGVVRFSGGFFDLPGTGTGTAGDDNDEERWNVAVVHGGVGAYGEIALEALSRHEADYVALGHYHRFERIPLAGGGSAVYPGPPLPFEYTAAAARGGYVLVELGDESVTAERVEMATPRLWRLAIADLPQWQRTVADLGDQDGVLITGYPVELQNDITSACDSDPRLRIAVDVDVYDQADTFTRETLAGVRQRLAEGTAPPDPELLEEAAQLVLTLVRTNAGAGIERAILEDLERLAADSTR